MATITLEHVSKRFPDGHDAVKDLSLEIADGEFMILVGPSGCGKSTALNMIAGLEDISEGELRIDGKVVNSVPPKERNIAMVFQNYALYPHMKVRDNMGFALRLAKVPKEEIDRRVREVAETLDLTAHLDRKPGQLSGGERQRVAMGRAIVRDPQAFLMDEPLSNLDAKLRIQMRSEVARLQSRLQTTTVYVTPDQPEAMTLGDRVAIMLAGELQQVGTPMELYNSPANLFVAAFIGSPGMNLIEGELDGETVRLPLVDVPLPATVRERLGRIGERRRVVAGIRPEHFEDAALVDDRSGGVTFMAHIDLLEAMGAEYFAHFADAGGRTRAPQPEGSSPERSLDGNGSGNGNGNGSGNGNVVARLAPESSVREGGDLELFLAAGKLQLFDAETGRSLTAQADGR
jgi:multiple sugar transport system ATP-binding protein